MNPELAGTHDRMTLAVLIAGAVHALLIFGVGFDALQREQQQRQVEVTLVVKATERPLEAQHFAQANQRGSGEEALRERVSRSQMPLPELVASGRAPREVGRVKQASAGAKPLTSSDATRRIPLSRELGSRSKDLTAAERELARLEEKLAKLQADLATQRPASEQNWRQARVRRISSVAALASIDAAYLADWRNRVEGVGNEYYPEASRRYGIYGSLEMLVTVSSDGGLDDIQVIRSRGTGRGGDSYR